MADRTGMPGMLKKSPDLAYIMLLIFVQSAAQSLYFYVIQVKDRGPKVFVVQDYPADLNCSLQCLFWSTPGSSVLTISLYQPHQG